MADFGGCPEQQKRVARRSEHDSQKEWGSKGQPKAVSINRLKKFRANNNDHRKKS